MQRSSKTIGNVVAAASTKAQGQLVSPEKSLVPTIAAMQCAEANTSLSKPMREAEASAGFGGFRPMPEVSAMSSLSERIRNIIVRFVALVIKRLGQIRLESIQQSPPAGGYGPIYFRRAIIPLSPPVPERQNYDTKLIRKTPITSQQIEATQGNALESARPKTQVGKEQSRALRLPGRPT